MFVKASRIAEEKNAGRPPDLILDDGGFSVFMKANRFRNKNNRAVKIGENNYKEIVLF